MVFRAVAWVAPRNRFSDTFPRVPKSKAEIYFSLRLLTVVHANRWDDFGKDLLILLLMPRMVKSSPKSGIFFCKSVVIIIFFAFFQNKVCGK